MKKVLILGAGLVVKPMVEYLLGNNIGLMIASPMKDRADEMIKGNPLGSSIDWSMDDPGMLEKLIIDYDITVSLLPYKYHSEVAKLCLLHGKPMVTTSYIQPEMKELSTAVEKAGLLFLNEIGLDPGIDHMTAMRIIDYIHSKDGKVEEFYSLCGALPAPEAADNPLKYKFTWSPKGVILASRNSALYLKKGKKVNIESSNLFKDTFIYNFPGIGDLEVYPNRDSVSYIDIYGISETKTMYRGTFRYKGWCETLDTMKSLRMLDDTIKNYQNKSYAEFMGERAGLEITDLKHNLTKLLGTTGSKTAIKSLDFLGFFSDEKLNYRNASPFDITSDRMIKKMPLADNEHDMVILQHIVLASYPDRKREVIKSSMLDYGSPSTNTSISRTVALPAAIAVRMILDNRIKAKGVCRPVIPEIYNPVLDELKSMGIEMKEEYGLPESEMIP
ncbi:MAG TPA: saccharopine dehydrogenase C-terminal domain-containing protein [Bacteroidales bacterium]|nr:saccharopine dehydrogenase C-terminal domain-containing protein [Bacteroidales bacterium]